jgi:hypothetical protein
VRRDPRDDYAIYEGTIGSVVHHCARALYDPREAFSGELRAGDPATPTTWSFALNAVSPKGHLRTRDVEGVIPVSRLGVPSHSEHGGMP